MAEGLLAPLQGQRRPLPERGSWAQALTSPKMCVRCYEHPPSMNDEARVQHTPLLRGAYLGPVHAVDHTDQFAAVQVPHPDSHHLGLVWMNIWSAYNADGECRGVAYCRLVHSKTLNRWQSKGWVNRFLDDLPQ